MIRIRLFCMFFFPLYLHGLSSPLKIELYTVPVDWKRLPVLAPPNTLLAVLVAAPPKRDPPLAPKPLEHK